MSSVGIAIGEIVKEDRCMCVWETLTVYPAQKKLIKKCETCKEKEHAKVICGNYQKHFSERFATGLFRGENGSESASGVHDA